MTSMPKPHGLWTRLSAGEKSNMLHILVRTGFARMHTFPLYLMWLSCRDGFLTTVFWELSPRYLIGCTGYRLNFACYGLATPSRRMWNKLLCLSQKKSGEGNVGWMKVFFSCTVGMASVSKDWKPLWIKIPCFVSLKRQPHQIHSLVYGTISLFAFSLFYLFIGFLYRFSKTQSNVHQKPL